MTAGPLGCDLGHDHLLVIGPGLPFNDRDDSFRACTHTGTKAAAEKVAYQACFSLNQLQCSPRTIRDALAASRILFLVGMNDLSFMAFTSGKLFTVICFRLLHRQFPIRLLADTLPCIFTPLNTGEKIIVDGEIAPAAFHGNIV
jgi:hypothetical protein